MKQNLVGTLVRFSDVGVGVVDVPDEPQFVYFKPAQIEGYQGETVKELISGHWSAGAAVSIDVDKDESGNVHVQSIALSA